MFRIRYYSDVIHPDHFAGKGLLGFAIRTLNWLRWRIEVQVQRLVLRSLAKDGALPAKRQEALQRAFDLDAAEERLEKDRTSPLTEGVERPPSPPPTRSERYADGRQGSAIDVAVTVDQDLPVRPKRIDDMIARYGSNGREKHYGKGRTFNLGNDLFEALDEEDK